MTSTRAGTALALIRLFNGTAAWAVPEVVLRRLGGDPVRDAAAVYPLRMFGVRTAVLGAELLLARGEQRRRVARRGIVVHGADVLAAAAAGVRGQVPRRVAVATVLLSSVNTGLAIAASRSGHGNATERTDE